MHTHPNLTAKEGILLLFFSSYWRKLYPSYPKFDFRPVHLLTPTLVGMS